MGVWRRPLPTSTPPAQPTGGVAGRTLPSEGRAEFLWWIHFGIKKVCSRHLATVPRNRKATRLCGVSPAGFAGKGFLGARNDVSVSKTADHVSSDVAKSGWKPSCRKPRTVGKNPDLRVEPTRDNPEALARVSYARKAARGVQRTWRTRRVRDGLAAWRRGRASPASPGLRCAGWRPARTWRRLQFTRDS